MSTVRVVYTVCKMKLLPMKKKNIAIESTNPTDLKWIEGKKNTCKITGTCM